MDSIEYKTARDVLELLQRIDNGDTLTEDELQNLNRITTADFSRLQLTSLPESICELTQLTELDVSWNQLTSLSESICKLT